MQVPISMQQPTFVKNAKAPAIQPELKRFNVCINRKERLFLTCILSIHTQRWVLVLFFYNACAFYANVNLTHKESEHLPQTMLWCIDSNLAKQISTWVQNYMDNSSASIIKEPPPENIPIHTHRKTHGLPQT